MTRRLVDLHTHSTASDGTLSPEAVVDLAEASGLAAVALTDHDTLAGLDDAAERAGRYPQLRFVPGIEVSAVYPRGTMHLLGLGIDPQAASLRRLTVRLREAREARNPKILDNLRTMGIDITMDDVLQRVPGDRSPQTRIVSRMHIAQVLVDRGLARNTADAMDRYVGNGGPAWVDKERTPPRECLRAIREAGGLAVLAHPKQLRCRNTAELTRVLRDLIEAGLGGIECYHSDHSPEQTRLYLDLAKRYRLALTGGSDFHGGAKSHVRLGRPPVPASVVPDFTTFPGE